MKSITLKELQDANISFAVRDKDMNTIAILDNNGKLCHREDLSVTIVKVKEVLEGGWKMVELIHPAGDELDKLNKKLKEEIESKDPIPCDNVRMDE